MTDIAGERARLARQGLVIVRRETWGAVFDYSSDRTVTRPANDLFLHITITNPDSYQSDAAHVRAVERIGISRFPATGMSYNALVTPSGTLHEGQPLTRRGAHTVNDKQVATCPTHGGSLRATDPSGWNLNYSVRALTLCQMLDDPVTDKQIDTAARWGAACIRAGEVKTTARWHGHRDVTNKDCPGSKAYNLIPELQKLTAHYVATGLGVEPDMTPDEIDAIAKRVIGIEVGTSGKSLGGFAQDTAKDLAAIRFALAGLSTPDVDEAALAVALVPHLPSLPVHLDEASARVLLDALRARLEA